jgi:luciferase family oxidoreductase group 1
MKLSILDQAPIPAGKSALDALNASVRLAQLGEELGYNRYWIAEHHDMTGLACPNPDVMLGLIGAATETIRIGAGAVLLPHYKPYRVAETYHLLATLFPDRIDLGIGRAPGGSAEVTMALSDNFLEAVRNYPEAIDELMHFLNNDFPETHLFSKITPTPVPPASPVPWLLGTSKKSALLAAEKGMAYTFGHFMSGEDGAAAVKSYKEVFRENFPGKTPYVITAAAVICAETAEEAEELALSNIVWRLQQDKGEGGAGIPAVSDTKAYPLTAEETAKAVKMQEKMIIGSPQEVKQQLLDLQNRYGADELMLITITHDETARSKSYQLIADACLHGPN